MINQVIHAVFSWLAECATYTEREPPGAALWLWGNLEWKIRQGESSLELKEKRGRCNLSQL